MSNENNIMKTYSAELLASQDGYSIDFTLWEDENEVLSQSVEITSEQYDDVEAGRSTSCGFSPGGYDLEEKDCDGDHRHGVWVKAA